MKLANKIWAKLIETNIINGEEQAVIIRALAKQEPKKPNIENGVLLNNGEIDCDGWGCPNCYHEFDWNELHYEYCPWCGQKLDWNFNEEEIGELDDCIKRERIIYR